MASLDGWASQQDSQESLGLRNQACIQQRAAAACTAWLQLQQQELVVGLAASVQHSAAVKESQEVLQLAALLMTAAAVPWTAAYLLQYHC